MHREVPGRKENLAAMIPDHLIRDLAVADEQHAPGRDQRIALRRFPRRYRICVLLVLALFGLHLFAAGSVVSKGDTLLKQHASLGYALIHTGLAAGPGALPAIGLGAGAASGERTNANSPTALCLNPLAATCWLQNAAQWMAQQIMNAVQPVIGAIMRS